MVWLLLPDTGCMGAGSHRVFSRESGAIPRGCHSDPHGQACWQQCFPTGEWLMTPGSGSGTFRIWQQVGGGGGRIWRLCPAGLLQEAKDGRKPQPCTLTLTSFLSGKKLQVLQMCVCVCVCVCVCARAQLYLTLGNSRLLCPWNFPGKNTGVGYHFLLWVIFPTQGSNPCLLGLLYWQVDSLPLNHLGSL